MKSIEIKALNGSIRCNYTKNVMELIDGLYRDQSKPLLMEINIFIRPITISTKSRGHPLFGKISNLPIIDIVTFDKDFNRVRGIKNVPNEKNIRMMLKEKYILEIPQGLPNTDGLLSLQKLIFNMEEK
jgi:hypothetical protein